MRLRGAFPCCGGTIRVQKQADAIACSAQRRYPSHHEDWGRLPLARRLESGDNSSDHPITIWPDACDTGTVSSGSQRPSPRYLFAVPASNISHHGAATSALASCGQHLPARLSRGQKLMRAHVTKAITDRLALQQQGKSPAAVVSSLRPNPVTSARARRRCPRSGPWDRSVQTFHPGQLCKTPREPDLLRIGFKQARESCLAENPSSP